MTETHAPVGGQMEVTRTTTTVRYYPTRAVQASTFSNREDVREKFYAKCAGLRRQSNPAEAPVVLSVILLDRPVTSYRDTAMLWDDLDTGHKFIVRPDRRNPKKNSHDQAHSKPNIRHRSGVPTRSRTGPSREQTIRLQGLEQWRVVGQVPT